MKNSKGITMISLIITIAVMVIISGVTVSISMDRFKINNVKKMLNDIELLNDKIEAFYLKYGGLPILQDNNNNNINYTYSELNFNRDINDNANYYIIDLSSIGKITSNNENDENENSNITGSITLNYGKEGYEHPNESDDVYIINEKTHIVYYVRGIESKDGTIYHSLALNDIQNVNVIGPTKPEINIISKNDTTIEVEIIPGKDNTSGIQKTEYNIKSTDIENNVNQTQNTQISDRTVVGNLSANKAHEITATTTSNNGSTSQNIYKINEWIEKLNVGDYVDYGSLLSDVTLTSSSKLITDLEAYSGNIDPNENTVSTISQEKNLGWKVLDVKNGKLRLISAVPTSSKIRLYGADGYNNGVYLLDEACDTLYGCNKGKAQNLKIEDIEEKIDTNQFDYGQENRYGQTREYTSNLQYPNIYSSEVGCKGIDGTNGTDNNNGTLGVSEQTSPITGSSTATSRLKATQTNVYKQAVTSTDFINSEYYKLFINNGSNLAAYWLSSRSVNCQSDFVMFGVRMCAEPEL